MGAAANFSIQKTMGTSLIPVGARKDHTVAVGSASIGQTVSADEGLAAVSHTALSNEIVGQISALTFKRADVIAVIRASLPMRKVDKMHALTSEMEGAFVESCVASPMKLALTNLWKGLALEGSATTGKRVFAGEVTLAGLTMKRGAPRIILMTA